MSWIDKIKKAVTLGGKPQRPDEFPLECKRCKEMLSRQNAEANLFVCPKCDHHFRLNARRRIALLTNPGEFVEYDQNLRSADPLKFKDKKRYKERVRALIKDGLTGDALICGSGTLGIHPVELCVFDFQFMGGSMGSVVGEKITRSIERAMNNSAPLIIVSCSGGARMQEGILSLMQMAKTTAELRRLADCGLPYISVLTDPTTGGVSASFAMLGDLIGFAGARVIEQTIRQKVPEGFQTAEFLLAHGLIDQVVHRKDLKTTLDRILRLLKKLPQDSLLLA